MVRVLSTDTRPTIPPVLGHLGADVDYETLHSPIAEWMPYTLS